MITIKFFSLLRLLIKQSELIIDEDNIKLIDLLKYSQTEIPVRFIHKLIDEEEALITGTIILVNGKNVHHLDKLDTLIKDGDLVSLFPPGGGG